MNSLVDIDGGTGGNCLIIVGTEGDNSYVVADGKVYGDGLSINLGAIERVKLTTVEGNDMFSILSTSPDCALPSMVLWDPTLLLHVHVNWSQWLPRISEVLARASLNTVSHRMI
jgi:hypothetical protein